ncbi:Junction-mediating and -regulatory [Gossypium arboreum]|uniref:Junction-mediating and-regulatory n=1 Tax=Gossypium arboreum TaxID=29729 RepID=A0A0B0MZ35_GOSAR|nr:Junction-mediating and -regulatory [Gossypium arboreum]
MNVPTLTLQTGHLESKVLRSPKDHFKPSVPNCSLHNNKQDIGNLHMLHQMSKMEGVANQRMGLPMNEKLPSIFRFSENYRSVFKCLDR